MTDRLFVINMKICKFCEVVAMAEQPFPFVPISWTLNLKGFMLRLKLFIHMD